MSNWLARSLHRASGTVDGLGEEREEIDVSPGKCVSCTILLAWDMGYCVVESEIGLEKIGTEADAQGAGPELS